MKFNSDGSVILCIEVLSYKMSQVIICIEVLSYKMSQGSLYDMTSRFPKKISFLEEWGICSYRLGRIRVVVKFDFLSLLSTLTALKMRFLIMVEFEEKMILCNCVRIWIIVLPWLLAVIHLDPFSDGIFLDLYYSGLKQ